MLQAHLFIDGMSTSLLYGIQIFKYQNIVFHCKGVEFLLPILASLSSASLEILVPKGELLTRGCSHLSRAPGEQPQSGRHFARPSREAKTWLMCLWRIQEKDNSHRPLHLENVFWVVLEEFWLCPVYTTRETSAVHTDFYLFVHLNGKNNEGLQVCENR